MSTSSSATKFGTTLISSNILGENSGSSGVYSNLFKPITNPAIIDGIGLTLLPDGSFVLPNGNYQLSYNVMASNVNCQISSGVVAIGGSSLPLSYNLEIDLYVSVSADNTGYYSYFSTSGSSIWNTSIMGNNIFLAVNTAQSSSPSLLVGYLSIVQLSV